MRRAIFDIALQTTWPNIRIWDSLNDSQEGSLYFRYTNAAAALIFIPFHSDHSILDEPEKYESDIFDEPHRIYGDVQVLDLLYYSEFSIIDNPPRICFHDPVKEFGISLNFQNKEEILEAQVKLSRFLTIESPNLPGFFKITRFLPPFGFIPKRQRQISFNSAQALTNEEILNVMILFQQSLKPTTLERPLIDLNDPCLNDKYSLAHKLLTHNLYTISVLESWLLLLNLPKIEEFSTNTQKYLILKAQWEVYTLSQLNRSNETRELISLISKLLLTKAFPKELCNGSDDFIRKFSFSVLMAIGQVDKIYTKPANMSFFIDILMIILLVVYPINQENNHEKNKVKLKNGKIVDRDTAEAITFWLLLRISLSAEHYRLMPLYSKDKTLVTETLTGFINKIIPSINYFLKDFPNFSDIADTICCLFSDILISEECIDLCTAALIYGSIHEFSIFFITVCIVFKFGKILECQDKKSLRWKHLIKECIIAKKINFLISATFSLFESNFSNPSNEYK
ncbi:hypothetical protein TRFO_26510 [Tritrichomonas foetus]|uniref:Uncharacterized protein n=1 Tax=Tritrichomonas foetus TaxID=1144522 RepID=A0A1J4K2G2_9EUKA|nr:hypothetical protein TRFO_26510 [Tritrichomonas foetus]|eukprot:OHT05633.1 hypothetical protein TRFO_26510 [Tritrichomonas foetus]